MSVVDKYKALEEVTRKHREHFGPYSGPTDERLNELISFRFIVGGLLTFLGIYEVPEGFVDECLRLLGLHD